MNGKPDETHLDEWAALVGASVPESTSSSAPESTTGNRAREREDST